MQRTMHARQGWLDAGRRLRGRLRQRDERGLTLIELTVTVALTGIVMAMTTLIVVNILNETSGENATIFGVQQAQIAERAFTQYLRSAVNLLSVQTNDLTFSSYAGMGANGSDPEVPQLQTIEAQLCTTKWPNLDSLEVIYGLPSSGNGSNGLHECIAANSPTSTTSPVPANVRLIEAFDIKPPTAGSDIFSYYELVAGSYTQVSTATAAANPAAVAAISINITFLPPPSGNSPIYHAELGTALKTEIFLRNFS